MSQRAAKQNRVAARAKGKASRLAKLDELISEAVVDCHNESEQITAFFTMIEDNLELPFTTEVLGMEVRVERIELTDAEEIVALCRRGRFRQNITILQLPLPKTLPRGAEWIEAYRRWVQGR